MYIHWVKNVRSKKVSCNLIAMNVICMTICASALAGNLVRDVWVFQQAEVGASSRLLLVHGSSFKDEPSPTIATQIWRARRSRGGGSVATENYAVDDPICGPCTWAMLVSKFFCLDCFT